MIENTSWLSQGVPLTDELLASIAVSLKRIADAQAWNRAAAIERYEKALKSAHHAMTLLHGAVATDRPEQVPGMDTDKYKNLVWGVDFQNEIAEIDAALAETGDQR